LGFFFWQPKAIIDMLEFCIFGLFRGFIKNSRRNIGHFEKNCLFWGSVSKIFEFSEVFIFGGNRVLFFKPEFKIF